MTIESAVLSSKFQVVIPRAVREELGLKPGQRLIFVVNGKSLEVRTQMTLEEFRGIAKGAPTTGFRDQSDRF